MSALKTALAGARFLFDLGLALLSPPKRARDVEFIQATTDEALRRAMPPKRKRPKP